MCCPYPSILPDVLPVIEVCLLLQAGHLQVLIILIAHIIPKIIQIVKNNLDFITNFSKINNMHNGWQIFKKECLKHKLVHPAGHEHPKLMKRAIALQGLLATAGEASQEYIDTTIQGKLPDLVRRELIIGRMYWYLFHFYDTLEGKVLSASYTDDGLLENAIIWKMTAMLLELQLVYHNLTNDDKDYIRLLKQVELKIHQLFVRYNLKFNKMRRTFFDQYKDKSEIIPISVEMLRKHDLLVEEYLLLLAIYKDEQRQKLNKFKLGDSAYNRNYYTDTMSILPQGKMKSKRTKSQLVKKGFLETVRANEAMMLTEQAHRLLKNQTFTK